MLNFKTIDLAHCEDNERISLSDAVEIAQLLSAQDSRGLPGEVVKALHNLHLSFVCVANQLRYWRTFNELFEKPNPA